MFDITKWWLLIVAIVLLTPPSPKPGDAGQSLRRSSASISFRNDVFPIIEKNCLPCHAVWNDNISGLALDSYDLLIRGGEHGSPIRPGEADSSLIIRKLRPNPPFGRQMPAMAKEKLDEETIQVIADWINQGAKDN